MQTNAPASGDFVDQFNRATTFGQVALPGSALANPLVLSSGASLTIPNQSGTIAVIDIGSDTIDFPNILANSTATHDVTVDGVSAGDAVLVTCTTARTGTAQRIVFSGFVATSPANTVTVLASNTSNNPIDLPSLSFKIIVFKGI
jgi:hypothetical protein